MTPRDEQILALHDADWSTRDIALEVGVSQSTASRVIRRHRANEARTVRAYVRSDYRTVRPMPDTGVFVRHSLYRFYDDADELLYVGITGSLPTRLDQHSADKVWFEDVATIRVEHFASRTELIEAEEAAIRAERPRHNRIFGDSSPWRRADERPPRDLPHG